MARRARVGGLALASALVLPWPVGAQEEGGSQERSWEDDLSVQAADLLLRWTWETWPLVQLRELRRLLDRGDREGLEAFAGEHFAPQLLESGAVAIVDRLIAQRSTGELLPWGSTELTRERAGVLLRSPDEPERWLRFVVAVEEQEPFKLTEVVLEPVRGVDGRPVFEAFPEERLPEALHTLVGELAQKERFMGAILLAKDGKVVLRKAYGAADLEWDRPNEPTTLFDLAELDQMLTGVAVARLVEDGALAFEDPIGEHLEGWVTAEVGQRVTVHQLLTHTSGLGDYEESAAQLPRAQPLRALVDYRPLTLAAELAFEPGTRVRESSTGYLLLGALVETLSGKSYEEYVHLKVHGPAMMTDTGLYALDHITGPRAQGYYPVASIDSFGSRAWRSNAMLVADRGTPAAGGWSTVDDLFSFARRLQQHDLLSEEMTETMLTPRTAPAPNGRRRGYGFEVVATGAGGRVWGLSGERPGASTSLEVHDDRGFVLVVLSNISGGAVVVGDLFRHLLRSTQPGRGR